MRYLLAILACVALDQGVKLWTAASLELYESAPLIPGVVELLYVRNTGGGFSILREHTWLLTIVTALLMAAIAALLWKKVFSHPLAMWTLTAVLGGGLGNLIDRVRLGYVIDMFNFEFMTWPVFNVADILVVCGVIGFAAYYLLLDDKIRPQTAGKRVAGKREAGRKEGGGDDGADHPDGGQ